MDDEVPKRNKRPWSALQPSRGIMADQTMMQHGKPDHAMMFTAPSRHDGLLQRSFTMAGGAAQWKQPRPMEALHHGAALLHQCTGSVMQPRPVTAHLQGWGGISQFREKSAPNHESETDRLDQLLELYESQVTTSINSLIHPTPQTSELALMGTTSSGLKQKLSEETEYDCGVRRWSHPLKLLLCKSLSMSDVGELGRIIIPKKSAESKFEQIDVKEGVLLEMQDYDGSKQWFFRLKFWINNKSRMYVLDNTGEFIKYHGLEEHDLFVLYVDSSERMVVRGHKETDLDSRLDVFQSSDIRSSPEKPSNSLGISKLIASNISPRAPYIIASENVQKQFKKISRCRYEAWEVNWKALQRLRHAKNHCVRR